jgi:hypothetical protein
MPNSGGLPAGFHSKAVRKFASFFEMARYAR